MNMISECRHGHIYHASFGECSVCVPPVIQALKQARAALRRAQREVAELEAAAKREGIDLEKWRDGDHAATG